MVHRIAALKRGAFDKAHFDGFAVFNPTNLLYFIGIQGAASLLVCKDNENTVYSYGVNYEQVKAEAKGFTVELIKREDNLMKKIFENAQEHKIKNLAFDAMSIESWRSLARLARGRMKAKLKGELVSRLRAKKDEEEIQLVRRAAEITSEGMKTAYEVFTPGMKEYEVAAEIEYAMRRQGSNGTAFETAVTSGPRSAFPHGGCSERTIHQGDLVVIDFGAVYKFYRSDMTRTLVAGKPSQKQLKLHALVRHAQEEAFKTMKPNAKTKDIDAAARRLIEDAGYGLLFVHGLGHGVGLDIHESPTLSVSSKEKLAVGNVVTNEPAIYLPGYGGVRIEDTVLVVRDGAERLTKGSFALGLE